MNGIKGKSIIVTGGAQGLGPASGHGWFEPFERRHLAATDAADRRDARDARLTVDEDGAASALSLRAAAVLRRRDAEPGAKGVEQRAVGSGDGDRLAVEGERNVGHEAPAYERRSPTAPVTHRAGRWALGPRTSRR